MLPQGSGRVFLGLADAGRLWLSRADLMFVLVVSVSDTCFLSMIEAKGGRPPQRDACVGQPRRLNVSGVFLRYLYKCTLLVLAQGNGFKPL